jgi:hypothetical protein
MGGGASANLTKSELVQIAKPDELVQPNVFNQWESQRGGDFNYPFGAQQQYLVPQQQQAYMPQVPQINIKMVGGNDFSKGVEGNGTSESASSSSGVNMTGGAQTDAFNNLVIPSMKGGGSDSSFKKEDSQKPQKTILGGLADFGSLVINKIM